MNFVFSVSALRPKKKVVDSKLCGFK